MDTNDTNALKDFLKENPGNTYAQVYRGLFSKNEEELSSAQHNDRMEFASEIFKRNFGMELIEALDFDDDEINDFVATVRIRIAEMQMENSDALYVEMFESEPYGVNARWDKEQLFNSMTDQDRDDLMDTAKNLYHQKTDRHFDGEIFFDSLNDDVQDVIYRAIKQYKPEGIEMLDENDSDSEIYKAMMDVTSNSASDAEMGDLLDIAHFKFESGLSVKDAVTEANKVFDAGPVSIKVEKLRIRLIAEGLSDINELSDSGDNNEQLFLEVFGSNPYLYTEEEATEIMAIAQDEADSGMVYSEAADEARNIWTQMRYEEIRKDLPSSIFENQNLDKDNIETPKKMVDVCNKIGLTDKDFLENNPEITEDSLRFVREQIEFFKDLIKISKKDVSQKKKTSKSITRGV